jgi:hypothetical protein
MFSSFSCLGDGGGEASEDIECVNVHTGDTERVWRKGPIMHRDGDGAGDVAGESSGDVAGDPAGSTLGSGPTESAAESAPA